MMKKEEKATELCRAMQDCVETLESTLKDSKVKMLQMHEESQKKKMYNTSGAMKYLKEIVIELSC